MPRRDARHIQAVRKTRDAYLAPPRSRSVYIHSLSVYVTTVKRNEPALLDITGRYPGWDAPGTIIYNQPLTNTNAVWLEIIHEFPE